MRFSVTEQSGIRTWYSNPHEIVRNHFQDGQPVGLKTIRVDDNFYEPAEWYRRFLNEEFDDDY